MIIAGSAAAGASLTFAVISSLIPEDVEKAEAFENINLTWEWPEEGEAPVEPIFSIKDNETC